MSTIWSKIKFYKNNNFTQMRGIGPRKAAILNDFMRGLGFAKGEERDLVACQLNDATPQTPTHECNAKWKKKGMIPAYKPHPTKGAHCEDGGPASETCTKLLSLFSSSKKNFSSSLTVFIIKLINPLFWFFPKIFANLKIM